MQCESKGIRSSITLVFEVLLYSLMRLDSPSALKRRRFTAFELMDYLLVKEKLDGAKQKFGREIRVFETSSTSTTTSDISNSDEQEDYYEFTAEDYYRILGKKKEDKFLKTKKLRDAEEAARKSRLTKAVIRVRFPENITFEAKFHPSETVQSLYDLLMKVVARPELPFYLYTTPPKKQLKDMSQDFYSAGFAPGAIVYFSYDLPKGDDNSATSVGPYLQEEIMLLKGLEYLPEPAVPTEARSDEPVAAATVAEERKPGSDKKMVKPKWLKM